MLFKTTFKLCLNRLKVKTPPMSVSTFRRFNNLDVIYLVNLIMQVELFAVVIYIFCETTIMRKVLKKQCNG
jgi:hypothetical protein